MRGLADGGLEGNGTVGGLHPGIALVLADNRIDAVKYRDMHNGNCSTGSPRSQLLFVNPVLARRGWRVIEAAGINGNLVPAANRVEILARARPRGGSGLGRQLIERTVRFIRDVGKSRKGQGQKE